MILNGCGRGNGLPTELTSHLTERGIEIAPLHIHAPLSSRSGYIAARYAPQIATKIVATFKLERILPEDPQWHRAIDLVEEEVDVKEFWGITGRPTQFRLKNGGQFEYFYLLITEDGLMYLIAEYAYG